MANRPIQINNNAVSDQHQRTIGYAARILQAYRNANVPGINALLQLFRATPPPAAANPPANQQNQVETDDEDPQPQRHSRDRQQSRSPLDRIRVHHSRSRSPSNRNSARRSRHRRRSTSRSSSSSSSSSTSSSSSSSSRDRRRHRRHNSPLRKSGLPNIQPFDGKTDINQFIAIFKAHAKAHRWHKKDSEANQPLLLIGKAASAYNQLPKKDKKNAKRAFKGLKQQLMPSETEALLAFQECQPAKNEPTREFALRIANLYDLAYPQSSSKQRDRDLRLQLTKYLPQHLQSLIPAASSSNWSETLRVVASEMPVLRSTDSGESPIRLNTNNVQVVNENEPHSKQPQPQSKSSFVNYNNNNQRRNNNNRHRRAQITTNQQQQFMQPYNQPTSPFFNPQPAQPLYNQFQQPFVQPYSNNNGFVPPNAAFNQSLTTNQMSSIAPPPQFGAAHSQQPQQPQNSTQSTQGRKSRRFNRQPGTCGRCQQPGHYAAICTAPAPVMSNQQQQNL